MVVAVALALLRGTRASEWCVPPSQFLKTCPKMAQAAGGYNRHLFIEGRASEFECAICSDVMRTVTDSNCGHGHIFCKSCLERAVATTGRCPSCQQPCRAGGFVPNLYVDRQVKGLQVKCAFEACAWHGPLAEQASTRCILLIRDDLKVQWRRTQERHSATCLFELIGCPHAALGCVERVARGEVRDLCRVFLLLRTASAAGAVRVRWQLMARSALIVRICSSLTARTARQAAMSACGRWSSTGT